MRDIELETSTLLWEVKQVLADSLPSESSVEVFAAQIQPKIASLLIRKLNLCAPLTSLSHVKRVRKVVHKDGVELSIILCLAPCGSCEWSSNNAPSEVSAVVEEHQLTPFVTTVPQHEACSREEWEDQCRLWPTSYHPNAVKLHQVVTFEESQIKDVCKFMGLAIRQAQLARKLGQPPNGVVIVDPSTGLLVSVGHDETGGWMNTPCDLETGQGQSQGCSCSEANPDTQLSIRKDHSWHPLRHAVMVAIERAAEKNTADSSGVNTKRLRISESSDSMERPSYVGDQYLCTGYDAYITREPCSMCAMALLHQRVRRVFYGIPNLKIGALGGLHRLHGTQGLNHHYLVFQVSLSEEDLVE
ncbi:hypothetical protein GOP47_0022508 [Adiantum capillus-veneris]|uniref:CMP/dCMP-type deaminase domain-containing protein n=1 Tax=Adiantum capillus-veneris TaxID=13818 RepID=A0A9D4U5H3_ADICA|nr:hypothetical protein GOP47_0022508 [Adiantum capillus-veneris]